jgi:hypothetical protein
MGVLDTPAPPPSAAPACAPSRAAGVLAASTVARDDEFSPSAKMLLFVATGTSASSGA